MTSTLYNRDYCLWLEKTVQLLQDGQLDELDIPNLIEEIEDTGKSQKHALESNLTVVLMHLLKYKYQPDVRSNSWKATIREHRNRLKRAFRDSPRLRPYFTLVLDECYQDARGLAIDETGLSGTTFPAELPFTADEILDSEYLSD